MEFNDNIGLIKALSNPRKTRGLLFFRISVIIFAGDNMTAISLADIEKKDQHIHAHRLLRECLKPYGINYTESTPVVKGRYGKPMLEEYPEIHFNLSHGDGIAACIVHNRECGIDCEKIREFRPNVLKRILSGQEQEFFGSVPDDEKNAAFFRIWTLKEAYIKAIGMGLSFPMNKAEFLLSESGFSTDLEGYKFKQYIIRGEFVVSVCMAIDESEKL